jgi:hypothetical protein
MEDVFKDVKSKRCQHCGSFDTFKSLSEDNVYVCNTCHGISVYPSEKKGKKDN